MIAYSSYGMYIEYCMKRGDKIPTRLIYKLLSFIDMNNSDVKNVAKKILNTSLLNESENKKAKIISQLINSTIDFECRLKENKTEKYNLQNLINYCTVFTDESLNYNKKELATYIHNRVLEYSLKLPKTRQKSFSRYMRFAITGRIIHHMYQKLHFTENPTNKILQDKIKYSIIES